MNIAKRTTHVAQWVRPRNDTPDDITGELVTYTSTVSTATTISCYCFQEGSREVMFDDTILRRSNRWRVLLPKERTDIEEGDLLINVIDQRGVVVLPKGRIRDIELYRKYYTSVEAIVATLEVN